MNCPKCGAANEPGRQECAACGVIFARWQPRPERVPEPPPSSKTITTVPLRTVIAVGVIVFVLGLTWTYYRRAAREKENAGVLPNAINTNGADEVMKARQARLEAEAAQRRTRFQADVEGPIRQAVEQCSWFQDPATVEVPTTFGKAYLRATIERYPQMMALEQAHLIAFAPPLGLATGRIDVIPQADAGVHISGGAQNTYRVEIGQRRITSFVVTSRPADDKVMIAFEWTYSTDLGNALDKKAPRKGVGTVDHTPSGWVLEGATVGGNSVCR